MCWRLLLPSSTALTPPPHASTTNCSVSWHTQPLDHFSYLETRTFQQRVFTYDKHWRRPQAGTSAGPILFYCGNEASVDLYVNATGWMWERAEAFGALLVWAEHRYYGKTQPFGTASGANASTLRWLTLEQALADYATLIHALKVERGAPASTKVIALGGSYGGMLAAWLRMHFTIGAMAHTLQSSHLLTQISGGTCAADEPEELLEQLVAYAVGGFDAERCAR